MPGTQDSRSGVGSTVDPKIETLNVRLQRSSQGGSLVPEGTEVHPEGWTYEGCVILNWRLAAVRTVSARRSEHVVRSWATVRRRLLLEEGVETDPEVWLEWPTEVGHDRYLEATSAATDQVALEARRLLQPVDYPKILLTETAPGWTTWKRCLSRRFGPEAFPLYSSGHT